MFKYLCRHLPQERVEFTYPDGFDELSKYAIGKKRLDHYFCPTCGVPIAGRGLGIVSVNLRVVDGLETNALELKQFDGASL